MSDLKLDDADQDNPVVIDMASQLQARIGVQVSPAKLAEALRASLGQPATQDTAEDAPAALVPDQPQDGGSQQHDVLGVVGDPDPAQQIQPSDQGAPQHAAPEDAPADPAPLSE